jgi:hypothetical protein
MLNLEGSVHPTIGRKDELAGRVSRYVPAENLVNLFTVSNVTRNSIHRPPFQSGDEERRNVDIRGYSLYHPSQPSENP